jgi:hypothetical protein
MTVIRRWNHQTGESYVPGEEPQRTGKLQIIRDIDGYVSPINGQFVSSRAARREDLKRNDCREVDPSENRYWQEKRQKEQAARDRNVERAVSETIQRLRNG